MKTGFSIIILMVTMQLAIGQNMTTTNPSPQPATHADNMPQPQVYLGFGTGVNNVTGALGVYVLA